MDSHVAPPPKTSSDESPTEHANARAFYCRVQAGVLERHAEKASGWLKREYSELAQQWLALERFHRAEAARHSGVEKAEAASIAPGLGTAE